MNEEEGRCQVGLNDLVVARPYAQAHSSRGLGALLVKRADRFDSCMCLFAIAMLRKLFLFGQSC